MGWISPSFSWLTLAAIALGIFVLITIEKHDPREILRAWAPTFGILAIIFAAIAFVVPDTILASLGLSGSTARIGTRFNGFANNPNQLSMFLTFAICALFLSRWHSRLALVRVGLVAIAVSLIFATGSDAGRISVLVSIPTFLILWSLQHKKYQIRVVAVLSLPALVLVFWSRIESIWVSMISRPLSEESNQLETRQSVWKDCIATIENNPLFGTGVNSVDPSGFECHNIFLEGFTISGIIGGFLFTLMLVGLLMRLVRFGNLLPAVTLITVLIAQIGNSSIRFPLLWVLFAAIYWLATPQPGTPGNGQKRPAEAVTTAQV